MQELLAIPLALATFQAELADAVATFYVDNEGVLGGLIKGSCTAMDMNQAIGYVWLNVAELNLGLFGLRVESKANIADGPTREYLDFLDELGAQYRVPALPNWCYDLWEFPRGD